MLQSSPPDSAMRIAWEKHVINDPAKNLPKTDIEALARVLEGKRVRSMEGRWQAKVWKVN